MRGLDRESMAIIRERMVELQGTQTEEALVTAGDDVRSVGLVLVQQPRLRRILSNPGVPEDKRVGLLGDLVGSRLSRLGHDICERIVRAKWRSPLSLLDAFDTVSAAAFLAAAGKAGELARVEDELFQFWRLLQANPQLTQALDEEAVPAARRAEMVRDLIGDSVHPTSLRLVDLTLTRPGGMTVLPAVERFMHVAAESHRSQIAFVTAAVPLKDAQIARLSEQLSSEQGRTVDVKVTVDPGIIGGVIVRIGDEIIDGSVARQIREARTGIARAG